MSPGRTRAGARRRISRFEARILGALVAVALVPLVAALLLGDAVLRDAYDVGVNPRIEAQLEDALDLYRRHLLAIRVDAEHLADAVAFDHRLVEALRSGDDARARRLLEARLEAEADEERALHLASVSITRRDRPELRVGRAVDPGEERALTLERTLDEGEAPFAVEVVVVTPSAMFERHERAGEVAEIYRRLRTGASYVSSSFLLAYSLLLLVVIGAALFVGLTVSRRLTRRVALLEDAARRVGAGDLTVELPADRDDEVDALVRAFNAMVRDIRTSRDRIEYLQRMAAWQEMARRLAHEIKNPLTPIQLAVQELHERYDGDDPRFARQLELVRAIVEEEVRTLRRLVSEFSDFARLPVPELEEVDLVPFTRDACAGFEPAAMLPSDQSLPAPTLHTELPEGPIVVGLDRDLLRKALDNLVRNAVQALAARARPGRVIVAVRAEGEHAVLEVRDDGPGIAASEREHVFDAYFTTKSEGTGLGLAITKKIVLEHDGAIECGAAKEGGAAFRIRLRIVQRPPARSRASAPSPARSGEPDVASAPKPS